MLLNQERPQKGIYLSGINKYNSFLSEADFCLLLETWLISASNH